MNRNGLYAVIAILVVAVVALGIAYQQESQSTGINIEADENGISIEADN
jgi:hypothetical protein